MRWYLKPYPGLPDGSQVKQMKASLYNGGDIPYFTVPPEHVPKILQALQPAEEVDSFEGPIVGVGFLTWTDAQGKRTTIGLELPQKGRCRFRIPYHSRYHFFVGGDWEALTNVISDAHTDSLKAKAD